MNRLTMAFLVLAALGGCMALDRDEVYESSSYNPPRRQPWPPSQSQWGVTDNRPVQGPPTDWGSRSSSYGFPNGAAGNPWSNPPPNATAAKKTANTSTVASAKPAPRPSTNKTDDKLVRTTHVDTKKSPDDDSDLRSPTAAARKSGAKMPAAEAKTQSVNLGVLRLINSKRITFRYEVKDPTSTGVSALELWGTTDMRNWKKYDLVTRTPTSLVTDVNEEGLYGFTMIARGKGELAKNQPPQAGEPPQVWVAVDLTKPVVQLLGAELDVTSQTPGLVIRWSAKDQHFGPRPITLLYAERAEGPWLPIAANVENNGRYEWIMPPCVPGNVYVRVQATDMMGNTSIAQTTALYLPSRSASAAGRGEPKLAEPMHLSVLPPLSHESSLRPVAAITPNPVVSILSVDSSE
jgi:hypothetical protein